MKRLFEFAAATSVRSPALATFGLLALAACSSERQMMEVDVADRSGFHHVRTQGGLLGETSEQ